MNNNCCGNYKKLICRKVMSICSNAYNYFLSKSNVVGLGLGYKVKNGFYTCKQCITNYYILCSNHILSNENTLPLGSPILQPSVCDHEIYPKDNVAFLSKFIPVKKITETSSPTNYVDCAIGKIISSSIAFLKIEFIGTPLGVTYQFMGQLVQKSGIITEYTTGKIIAIGVTTLINFITGKFLFQNQIVTTSMSQKGDSGSLLLDNQRFAEGLLCAVSQVDSLYNPITTVLNNLGVSIVMD